MKLSTGDFSSHFTENTINIYKEAVLIVSLLDTNEETNYDFYWEECAGFDKQKKLKFHDEYNQLFKRAKRFRNKGKSFLNVKSSVEGFKWAFNAEDNEMAFIVLFEENLSSKHLNKFLRRLNIKVSQRRFLKEKAIGDKLRNDLKSVIFNFNKHLRKQCMSNFLSISNSGHSEIMLSTQNQSAIELIKKDEETVEVKEELVDDKERQKRLMVVRTTFVLAIGFSFALLIFQKFFMKVKRRI